MAIVVMSRARVVRELNMIERARATLDDSRRAWTVQRTREMWDAHRRWASIKQSRARRIGRRAVRESNNTGYVHLRSGAVYRFFRPASPCRVILTRGRGNVINRHRVQETVRVSRNVAESLLSSTKAYPQYETLWISNQWGRKTR
jgi:hypothetical protein